ncbi:hypothetical protein RN001_007693 [Aquatica leii]|uniref:rRNA-processing protein UTP23 homolog n=1 Tax=Aquatica leii TaxID=1421715 RepID=A0AAN7PYE1_9COLE|nr:hypothetical protein RN001_007693 [Aquatica leii]
MSKNINFYINNFKFRQPYQMLVDGTFCFAALNNKINIQDNLPRYLQSELKFRTTSCVIIETERLGRQVAGALIILKNFLVHKCGHESRAIPGAECLLSMVQNMNPNHYIVATQDHDLQSRVRTLPAVPLLYFVRKTPVLDQPSLASLNEARSMMGLGPKEKETISQLKAQHGIAESTEIRKKRRKQSGPNPLSCKKKKKQAGSVQSGRVEKLDTEKKKRKKIRISKHVKEMLCNIRNNE